MPYIDLNDFFAQVQTKKVPTLEQWNYLETKTSDFNPDKTILLLNDLKDHRERAKKDLLLRYKEAKKTRQFKSIVKNGDQVPFIDIYEGCKGIGREDDLSSDFYLIEGEKYLDLFFPKELEDLDKLINRVQTISISREKAVVKETIDMDTDSSLNLNSESQGEKLKSPLNTETKENPGQLTWMHEPMNLVEIIKALVETKSFGEPQNKVFARFESLFKIDLKEKDRLHNLRNRTTTPTPFLNSLQDSLSRWIDK